MSIVEAILARGEAGARAVVCGESVLTYHELRRDIPRIASALLSRGHGKGDRIGIWAENGPFFVLAYLGVIRAAMVAVPLSTELEEATFRNILVDAGIKEVFVSTRFLPRLRQWAEKAGVAIVAETELSNVLGDPCERFPEIEPVHDLASLMFTSGSTGAPKGVMVSHRNIECNTRDIISYVGLGPNDRCLVVLPFHYCFGVSLLHTLLMAGGTIVVNNEFRLYPETALQDLKRHECTGLAGVPSTYQSLLRKSRFGRMSLPSLRWLQQAGGKLPNPYVEEILAAFPDVRFFLMYGQTEATARLSFLPPERLVDKLGSIGRGLPSTRLQVLGSDTALVLPGSGETGEIVAAGDNIALGYWNDVVETSKYFRNGLLHTGDLALVDQDGFISIVERERDMIKSGGNRVSAKEVEDVIAELQGVVEVAVVGAPHDFLGESIKAFVVAQAEKRLAADAIKAHCRKRLASFKIPQEVFFLARMPHNSSGKILKAKLKDSARGLNTAVPVVQRL